MYVKSINQKSMKRVIRKNLKNKMTMENPKVTLDKANV